MPDEPRKPYSLEYKIREEVRHVSPIDDLIEHDTESPDCICGPRVTPIELEDGSIGWLYSHHALDRERFG